MARTDEAICNACHKPIIYGAKASITSWIFRDYRCRCRNPLLIATQPNLVQLTDAADEIADYELIELLGAGGMGVVYKARKKGVDSVFAVKILKKDLLRDASVLQRFDQEAELAKQMNHPNLTMVYDSGLTSNGAPYLVMDLVDGESLDKCLGRETSIEARRAIDIFVQVCEAMEYAHSIGVLHRDIKPSNILISEPTPGVEIVKVVDFGIAKLLPKVNRETLNLTKTGELFGSPFYMSPEQCMGEELNERSDIYSMGCVMYEVLTGAPPFKSDNPVKTVLQQLTAAPRPCGTIAAGQSIPADLEDLVLSCLSKGRELRPESMTVLRQRLEAIASRMGQGKTRMHASVFYFYRRNAIMAWLYAALILLWSISALLQHSGPIAQFVIFSSMGWLPIRYMLKMRHSRKIDRILSTRDPEAIDVELFKSFGSYCVRFACGGGKVKARVMSVYFRGGRIPSEVTTWFNGSRRKVLAYRDESSGEPVAIILGRYLCVVSAGLLQIPMKTADLPLLPPASKQ